MSAEQAAWRPPSPELGPLPGDGTGGDGDGRVPDSPAQQPRFPPVSG
jgi:hypothetical protein